MANQKIDLKAKVEWDRSLAESTQDRLYEIFNGAINHNSPTQLTAESSAGEFDKLFPEAKEEDDAENYLWVFFTEFIDVAQELPPSDARQQLLVSILERLKAKKRDSIKIWGGDCKMWEDLPMFGPCMREAWNFVPHFDGTADDKAAIKRWISLNSFCARVVGSKVKDFTNFAIWGLRESLEEKSPSAESLNTHLAVAHEWITHAGKRIWEEGKAEKELDDHTQRMLQPGALYKEGKSGFHVERWQFWSQKLTELGQQTDDAELKKRNDKVIEQMKQLEG